MTRGQQREAGAAGRSLTRRDTLRGMGVGAAAALGLAARGPATAAQAEPEREQIEPGAVRWHTWLLDRADQLRPDPPPAEEDFEGVDAPGFPWTPPGMMMHWNAGSPGYRWNQVATRYALDAELTVGRAYRAMALLNVAIHDATIAVWDAKYHYNRPRPVVPNRNPNGAWLPAPNAPSYPSVHGATASAAETVLGHLFPDRVRELTPLADEAAMLLASCKAEYLSDVEAGRAIGAQVGELALAWAADDGSDAAFDLTTLPTGEGLWTGEPEEPGLGEWRTWVIPDGVTIRVGPPPSIDPAGASAELDEVRAHVQAAPTDPVAFWPDDPMGRVEGMSEPVPSRQAAFHYARAAHLQWVPELAQKLAEYRLDTNPPWAARAYAMVSIAVYDATVAAWHEKFRHMAPRPDQLDPAIVPLLPAPATPAYPSAHAAAFGAMAEVLVGLFGWDAGFHFTRAVEGAASRVWAGVSFPSAADTGLQLGRDVGARVVTWVESDRVRQSAHPVATLPFVDPACT